MSSTQYSQLPKELIVAIATAAFTVLFAAFVPLLGMLVGPFVPLPFLFYQYKLGRRWGIWVLVAATTLASIIMGLDSFAPILFVFGLGLLGVVLAEMLRMNVSVGKTVAITAGVVILIELTLAGLYSLFSDWEPLSLVVGHIRESIKLTVDILGDMGAPKEQVSAVSQSTEEYVKMLLHLLPSLVLTSTFVVVWGNLLAARSLFRRRQLLYPSFGALNRWTANEYLIWLPIASGLALLVPNSSILWGVRTLGINGLIVAAAVYFFQGIAIVSYFFEKKNLPRPLRAILYGLVALHQPFLLIVVGLGLFDMWADFRKIRKAKGEEDESNSDGID